MLIKQNNDTFFEFSTNSFLLLYLFARGQAIVMSYVFFSYLILSFAPRQAIVLMIKQNTAIFVEFSTNAFSVF